MSVFDVGDYWSRTFYVRNAAGALVAPGAFTCTLTMADGTSPSVTVVNSATGTYDCSFGPLTALHIGRNLVFAAATGANACSMPDQFDVRSSASTALLSLDDARRTLNYNDPTVTADDEEIRDYVDAVTSLIEARIGPVIQRTISGETVHGRDIIVLAQPPVISVTSITPQLLSGIQVLNTDVIVDGATGTVRRVNRDTFYDDYYTVVYVAGRTSIPSTVLQAARVLLQHLWRTQRGSGSRPGQGMDDTLAPYSMPNRVLELLADEMKVVGIA